MLDDEVEKFHEFADFIIQIGEKTRQATRRDATIKKDGTPRTVMDVLNERDIVAYIREHFPDMGVRAEEFNPWLPRTKKWWEVDPLDGTKFYLNELNLPDGSEPAPYAIIAGQVERDEGDQKRYAPVSGIIVLPALRMAFKGLKEGRYGNHAGIWQYNYDAATDEDRWNWFYPPSETKPFIGTDFGPTSPDFYKKEVEHVANVLGKEQKNMPAGYAAVAVLLGLVECWWSYTLKSWDTSAPLLLLNAFGFVGRTLFGRDIDMNVSADDVAPVIYARSDAIAWRVEKILAKLRNEETVPY